MTTSGRERSSTPDLALVRDTRSALSARADPQVAPQMQRYMKSSLPFYGVKAPAVRAITRELVDRHPLETREGWERAVRVLYDGARRREERYVALGIAGHRRFRGYREPAALPMYRHLAVTGAWWDLVDTVAAQVGEVLASHRAETSRVLRRWARDDDLWLRRVAILSQLKHRGATDRTFLDEVLTVNASHRDFFVRKAIGWALREYAKTDPTWVREYVDAHRADLSPLSVREAEKHLDVRAAETPDGEGTGASTR